MAADALEPAAALAALRTPIFPGETPAYAEARRHLLASEIEARRVLTALADERRALPPGPIVDKDYRFRDGAGREMRVADLFDGRQTLITYFWMYGPERDRPCPMCTDTLAGLNSVAVNVEQRAALKILGRSPVPRQVAFARKGGWDHLTFIETIGDAYAIDTQALTPDGDEYPSFIVYQRHGEDVRVFYAAEMPKDAADPEQDPRGATDLSPLWNILDHTPEGRARIGIRSWNIEATAVGLLRWNAACRGGLIGQTPPSTNRGASHEHRRQDQGSSRFREGRGVRARRFAREPEEGAGRPRPAQRGPDRGRQGAEDDRAGHRRRVNRFRTNDEGVACTGGALFVALAPGAVAAGRKAPQDSACAVSVVQAYTRTGSPNGLTDTRSEIHADPHGTAPPQRDPPLP
ncbi:DUF899 family protein [Sphingomonas sp. RS2018]